jgi:ribonuclease-3 family protein
MTNNKELPAVMALSYLGDAVYSLFVRRRLVEMGISHAGDLNRLSLSFVTAPRQAETAARLLPLLTEWETDIYRRAYNHKGLGHPSHATYAEYRAATGFKAVLGALHYLGEEERLAQLLNSVHADAFQKD